MKIYTMDIAKIAATPIGTVRNGGSVAGHILSMAFRRGTRVFLYTPDGVCREECEAGSARANQIVSDHAEAFEAHGINDSRKS